MLYDLPEFDGLLDEDWEQLIEISEAREKDPVYLEQVHAFYDDLFGPGYKEE